MQWMGRRESDNVETGSSSGRGGLAVGGGVAGLIGLVIYFFTGINPAQILGGGDSNQQGQEQTNTKLTGEKTEDQKFVSVVLADTEDVWNKLFQDMGKTYKEPTLHLFEGGVDAEGCGFASSATGPFYCPADSKVYIDLSFFQELQDRFGASGEFARAYVVAHEVGHHIQNLLGTSAKMDQARQQMSETEYNKLSVKLELQADFYAGVWAHYEQSMKGVINESDIQSALTAANAIGDDHLQKEANGRVEPDSFTHGTSAQRVYWFKKGYQTGDIRQGNTFEAEDL